MIIEADVETALDSIKNKLPSIEADLLNNLPVRAYVKVCDLYDHVEDLRKRLLARSQK